MLDFKKTNVGDWIKFPGKNDTIVIAKVLVKIKNGLICDNDCKIKTKLVNKNIEAFGVLEGRKRSWFRNRDMSKATKIMDIKETGNLKDIAIKRLIKLKGLDQ